MKILVINGGSSSIKYKLYEFPQKRLIAKGIIERIGEKESPIKNHSQAISELISKLVQEKIIDNLGEISAIGHRVVHGGETFRRPHIIDKEVMRKIQDCARMAPLHNPANLAGITGCRKFFPTLPQAAVFDTAFHQSIPEYAYMYAIAPAYYKKYKIRKYGFHGTSHQFVAKSAAKLLNKPLNKLKLITCHLGNGCSITAVDKGKSIDTSMGFTPLEGLMMGTRSGDIDAATVLYIMEKEELTINQMNEILNKKSGLLGVSGLSNDIRTIKKEITRNRLCRLALEMFIYRIKKYIGAYVFILGGIDAICFTGGIGENNPGIINKIKRDVLKIAPKKTRILVIPTDEELMIADLTYELVKRGDKK